jgi:hypothetical protein
MSIASSSMANATRSPLPGWAAVQAAFERVEDRPVRNARQVGRILRRLAVLGGQDDHGAALETTGLDLRDHRADLRVDVVE